VNRIRSGAGRSRQQPRIGAPDPALTPNAGLAVITELCGRLGVIGRWIGRSARSSNGHSRLPEVLARLREEPCYQRREHGLAAQASIVTLRRLATLARGRPQTVGGNLASAHQHKKQPRRAGAWVIR
jgi:hypothetical protein